MDKATLRVGYKARRSQLTAAVVERYSRAITDKLRFFLSEKPMAQLHVFLSMDKEVDTRLIIEMIRENFPATRLIVPLLIPGSRDLAHYYLEDDTRLKINQWGIPEPDPVSSQVADPLAADGILVPLLAFDRLGNRVGYGGGYYDRFLALCRPDAVKIGLSFFEPVAVITDASLYDVPLDYCITGENIFEWSHLRDF